MLCITLISLVISYFSIKYFGILGLIFSINFYIIANSQVLYFFGKKVFSVKIEKGRLFVIVLLGIFLSAVIFFLSNYSPYIYYPGVLAIGAASLIVLYKSYFLSKEEKTFINNMVQKVFP